MAFRIRHIPSYILLGLLHLIFTVSSLLLRLFETLSTPPASTAKRDIPPPKHIALVLVPSTPARRKEESVALVESVKRLVDWAGQEGTAEVSVWDERGLLHSHRREILDILLCPPYFPPESAPASPSPLPSSPDHDTKPLMMTNSFQGSYTCVVYTSTSRPITLHLLPPSAAAVMGSLTEDYISTGRRTGSITTKLVDVDVRAALGYENDPDLLIVHQLSPPSFLRALLPRPPPELHSYPFWPLRITEIYQYSTPLPVPQWLAHLFSPLVTRAQSSPLPLLRKAARLLPYNGDGEYGYVQGAVSEEEWVGAMEAWSQVEQRLGK